MLHRPTAYMFTESDACGLQTGNSLLAFVTECLALHLQNELFHTDAMNQHGPDLRSHRLSQQLRFRLVQYTPGTVSSGTGHIPAVRGSRYADVQQLLYVIWEAPSTLGKLCEAFFESALRWMLNSRTS